MHWRRSFARPRSRWRSVWATGARSPRSRRTRIAAVLAAIEAPGEATLAEARAAFEARAQPVRAYLREQEAKRASRASDAARRRELELRAATLREMLARMPDGTPPTCRLPSWTRPRGSSASTPRRASRLAPLHLDGKNPSAARACEKWAKANDLRAPRIEPVLRALAGDAVRRARSRTTAREDVARQQKAIEATLAADDTRATSSARPSRVASSPSSRPLSRTPTPSSDPSTRSPPSTTRALAVRDAWARGPPASRSSGASRRAPPRARRAEWGMGQAAVRTRAPGARSAVSTRGVHASSMRAGFPLERDVIDRLVHRRGRAVCAGLRRPWRWRGARRAMLTGDTAQLPPVSRWTRASTSGPRAGWTTLSSPHSA